MFIRNISEFGIGTRQKPSCFKHSEVNYYQEKKSKPSKGKTQYKGNIWEKSKEIRNKNLLGVPGIYLKVQGFAWENRNLSGGIKICMEGQGSSKTWNLDRRTRNLHGGPEVCMDDQVCA